MADQKVTTMVLKVDLQCRSCYKKIKKLLCKFPQIRNQVYDEKQNTVTITVVCCSPEKIRDKLCCKGGKTIKSIAIVVPPKPKPPEKPKEPEPKQAEKPKEPEKPKPKEPEKPKVPAPAPAAPKPPEPAPKAPAPAPAPVPKPPEPAPKAPLPVAAYPVYPVGTCCGPCYEGYSGGPCYDGHGHGHGRPVPWYDNYGYGPSAGGCGCGCGGVRGCNVRRPGDYFSDENTSGCTIM